MFVTTPQSLFEIKAHGKSGSCFVEHVVTWFARKTATRPGFIGKIIPVSKKIKHWVLGNMELVWTTLGERVSRKGTIPLSLWLRGPGVQIPPAPPGISGSRYL